MKTYRKNSLLLLSVLCLMTACTEFVGIHPISSGKAIKSLMQDENQEVFQWQVSYFYDNDKDETIDYKDYRFDFGKDGVFQAIDPGGKIHNGNWKRTSIDGLPRMVISISGNERLDELSDDWVLLKIDGNLIELEDDNEEQVESLHFSRN